MRHKIIATVAGIGLVSLAAVGAFASQDAINSNDSAGPAVLPVATDTTTPTGTLEATQTATATPNATDTATPTSTGTATVDEGDGNSGHGERDIKGIPTENPSHHPEDGDGVCEKGETVIKTTPSGVRINVPCQTEDHANDGPDSSVSPQARSDEGSPDGEQSSAQHDADEPDEASGD